jgi:hypothetical protein
MKDAGPSNNNDVSEDKLYICHHIFSYFGHRSGNSTTLFFQEETTNANEVLLSKVLHLLQEYKERVATSVSAAIEGQQTILVAELLKLFNPCHQESEGGNIFSCNYITQNYLPLM